jgi:hypothetical protein
MNRLLAFIAAIILATVSVTSACLASPYDAIRFTLGAERGDPARIHARFNEDSPDRRQNNNWSSGFMPSDLIGLEVSSFHAAGSRPLHFAIVREAGRLDCAGNGGNDYAVGNCRFSENTAFSRMLADRGIGRPTREQAFALTAINAHRAMIDAIAAAHYPTPTIDDVVAMAALNVSGAYITEMARAGYRPRSVQSLIEFKALNITPEWIGGFARVGYANLPGDGLVQLRALNVTPDFIAGYQRIGYRQLPVDTLVQLKALGITPQFVSTVVQAGRPMPSVDDLMQLKLFGRRR